jgi:hypothetical protein
MAGYDKFYKFVENVHHGIHDLETDQLKVALCTAAPTLTTDEVKADLTEISAYTNVDAGGTEPPVTTTSSGQTGGIYDLVLVDLTITATGGAIPTWRYAVVYNDTPSTPLIDPLIASFDYGSNLDLANGESVTLDWDSGGANSLFTAE